MSIDKIGRVDLPHPGVKNPEIDIESRNENGLPKEAVR